MTQNLEARIEVIEAAIQGLGDVQDLKTGLSELVERVKKLEERKQSGRSSDVKGDLDDIAEQIELFNKRISDSDSETKRANLTTQGALESLEHRIEHLKSKINTDLHNANELEKLMMPSIDIHICKKLEEGFQMSQARFKTVIEEEVHRKVNLHLPPSIMIDFIRLIEKVEAKELAVKPDE